MKDGIILEDPRKIKELLKKQKGALELSEYLAESSNYAENTRLCGGKVRKLE